MDIEPTDLKFLAWGDHPHFETVRETIVDQRRWSTCYELILKHLPTGKLYQGSYARASNECSGDNDYRDLARLVEVEAYERTTTDYRKVA